MTILVVSLALGALTGQAVGTLVATEYLTGRERPSGLPTPDPLPACETHTGPGLCRWDGPRRVDRDERDGLTYVVLPDGAEHYDDPTTLEDGHVTVDGQIVCPAAWTLIADRYPDATWSMCAPGRAL